MATKYTFKIYYNGQYTTVNPTNFHKNKFTWEQKDEQIFFRKKYNGTFIFDNKTGEFNIFWNIEKAGQSCNDILFYVYACGRQVWKGVFSTGGGKFDLDRCTFEVQPQPSDKYNCFLEEIKKEYNVLQMALSIYEIKTVQGTIHNLKHIRSLYTFDAHVENECFLDGVNIACPSFTTWCLKNRTFQRFQDSDHPGKHVDVQTSYYSREEITTACSGGLCVAPSGTGWVLLTSNCPTGCTYYRCSAFNQTYDSNRKLNDIIEAIVADSECGILGVKSIFLNINPDTSDPFYALTNGGVDNYITASKSWTNQLMISQKADIKDPNASNSASVAVTTLEKILKWLTMFRVFWDIDANGYLILEHYHWWEEKATNYNFLSYDKLQLGRNVYEHNNTEVPLDEEFSFMENDPDKYAQKDFKGVPIHYNSPCANIESNTSFVLDDLTTNIEFIHDYPDAISDDGFVMIASELVAGVYYMNNEITLYTGHAKMNGHLSWPNLQYNYWRYDRYLPSGLMNNQQQDFISWKPNVKQVAIEFPWCCADGEFDPNGKFITVLGTKFLNGKFARMHSAELDVLKDSIKLVFKYSIWQQ